jgi:hypothetical protein
MEEGVVLVPAPGGNGSSYVVLSETEEVALEAIARVKRAAAAEAEL